MGGINQRDLAPIMSGTTQDTLAGHGRSRGSDAQDKGYHANHCDIQESPQDSRNAAVRGGVSDLSLGGRNAEGPELSEVPFCAQQSHAGASSVNEAFVSVSDHAIAAPTAAHYGATCLPQDLMETYAGYPVHHSLPPVHGMAGNIGATTMPIPQAGTPHAVDYNAARGGKFQHALQVARDGGSSRYPRASVPAVNDDFGPLALLTAQSLMPHTMDHDATRGGRVTKGQYTSRGVDSRRMTSAAALARAARAVRTSKLRGSRSGPSMSGDYNMSIPPATRSVQLNHLTGANSSPPISHGRRSSAKATYEERRMRNRDSVQRCRAKKKEKMEALQKENELYDKEHKLLRSMFERQKKVVSELRDRIPPETAAKLEEVLAFVDTLPPKPGSDFHI